MSATFLRVGLLAVLVGQLSACPEPATSTPPARPATPDLVIAPLAGGRPPPSTNPDGVRFGHPPAAVGSTWTVTVHATSRSAEQWSGYESELRVEVLAIEGPAPSRLGVQFLRNVQSYQGAAQPTAVDGKRYTVESRAPHVRDASGAAAGPEETQRVLDILPDLGTRSRIDEVLPDDALDVGARYDALAPALLRVLHPRAWTLVSGTATLSGANDGEAVFDVTLVATSEKLRMDVSGQARVRTSDARLVSLVLRGPYGEVVDAGSPDGTFELTRTVTSGPDSRSGR